jgi:hypothetical protein
VPVYDRAPDGTLVPAGAEPIHALLFPAAEWDLVARDAAALLYLRKEAAARAWPEGPIDRGAP